ncbi:DNA repair protein RadA [Candidatus Endoriftia persephonae]|jgi:DNA repair protein RadA/Sms|uniref:DNA repair protein RadA n=2 Tax=Gammaproteobacteria TaxID=1236 RepID=G2FCF8_9GAMM|nr:DNA repair protein RadA [Candidatus Endoriftia persephone]EGW55521.1 DNA repair protein RadA [endosymbiont of Tevnia jerichonana (vent Tica)]USF86671.1 DNA repair protein RadA [Candidatus Endoriftia persephone]
MAQGSRKSSKSVYSCSACGATSPKWAGQCPDCKAWNTLEETVTGSRGGAGRYAGYAGASQTKVFPLASVETASEARRSCGSGELDRVLGGGLVDGSVVLLGGDPGIGKSTLLIQTLAQLAREIPTLYVSGEESPRQIALRAQRLGLQVEQLQLLPETAIERIIATAEREHPAVMVVDSIQTMYTELLQSAPGSVSQVRESTAQLVQFAKRSGTAVFLVGHVTKEGSLAGPRVLEHMVDTVLYFEGEVGSQFRLIRAIKNRFGAVNELGVFAMTEKGLKEVSNPSAIFLSRHSQSVPGSVILVTREGTRPLLVEAQALVDESPLANPRRVTLGLEQNRLSMLLAVLHRHCGIGMFDQDVYVNVVGGVRITETAADLAVLLAVLSSFRDRPLPEGLVAFGEVGLTGEIRPVPNGQDRLREAAKHGFKLAILPKANAPKRAPEGVRVVAVERLAEVLDAI